MIAPSPVLPPCPEPDAAHATTATPNPQRAPTDGLFSSLLDELHGVLRRDKFREWLDLDHAVEFVAELERRAETAVDPAEVQPVSSDPDDDYLVPLARSTRVDALVSGDADLTELDLDDLTVLTPRQLLDEVAVALDDPAPEDERL